MTLYYEAHITVEPVFGVRLEAFRELADLEGFRVADLLMQKRPDDTPERSKFDTFCTGRSQDFEELKTRMVALVNWLQHHGFKVWRYKIEDTLLDSRYEDALNILTKDQAHDDDGTRPSDCSGEPEPEEPGVADNTIRASDPSGVDYINRHGHRALWVC